MVLSIIIPVFNVEDYVERCILSTQNQDVAQSEYEVVIINDGSTDRSLEIVQNISSNYRNVAVYNKSNGGLSSARNYGITHSNGTYIMFLDSDDWIATNCLQKLICQLKSEQPDCLGICSANVEGSKYARRFSYKGLTPIIGKDYLKGMFSPCATFSIWRREFLKQNNIYFMEGIYHEDYEFTPRAYYLAQRMSFTNDIIYFVYQNPNSITRTVNPQKSFDLIERVSLSLYNFSKGVDRNYQYLFYDLIAVAINNALDMICECNCIDQRKLNLSMHKRAYLYDCLMMSDIIKYKFEACLFKLFPSCPLAIYKIITTISRPFTSAAGIRAAAIKECQKY